MKYAHFPQKPAMLFYICTIPLISTWSEFEILIRIPQKIKITRFFDMPQKHDEICLL